MSTPFFEIRGLHKHFGGVTAIQDLSFCLEQGQIMAIIGPNGAGKTTVFNCISGLYRPDRGAIMFGGKDLTRLEPWQTAQLGIARTFQNLELFDHLDTMENLMLGRHLHMKTGLWRGMFLWGRRSYAGREEIQHRESVERVIDLLDLQAVRNKIAGDLPYGTRKLIELGRALALDPKLLLLDEPAAGMTAEERQDLFFWIKDIRDELGITILMIEHHMQMVMNISDHILTIDFGKSIAEGTPAEIAAHPDVIRAYLGG